MIKLFLFVLIISFTVFADSFTASASSTTIGEGDQFQVTFTFEGGDINSISGFSASSFSDFLVLSGPNQSTSMQIINGVVSGSLSYSYYLQPRSMGKFTIGSASVNYKGKTFKTEPLKIEVVKGTPKQKQNTQDPNAASTQNEEIAKNCFVRAVADKHKVYQGEQVTITYKLYTRLNIASQMSVSKLPQYQGFWSEELETSQSINFTTEVLEGRQYRVGILKKAALFPTQSGDLEVTPFELKVPVQIQKKRRTGNSIFDDFFNDPFFGMAETIEYTAKSNTLKINVLPLPENKPSDFNGAVGTFTISSSLDKQSTKTNEPVSLKVNISGTGNIQLLSLPEVNLPTGLEKYEPKTEDQISRAGKISGTKKIEYILVPRIPGKKEIPPVIFSYFDPQKRTYVTLNTPGYTIHIQQGTTAGTQEYSKEDVRMLGYDIRYIKNDTSLSPKGDLLIEKIGFWTAAAIPMFALLALIVWKRKDEQFSANLEMMKYQKARKMASKRLKNAKLKMQQNKREEFYTEISAALFGYLEDKLHIAKSDFTLEGAADVLQSKNVDGHLISDLKDCAEKCQFVRFAPVHDQNAEMSDMYARSENIIIEIERNLSGKKHAA